MFIGVSSLPDRGAGLQALPRIHRSVQILIHRLAATGEEDRGDPIPPVAVPPTLGPARATGLGRDVTLMAMEMGLEEAEAVQVAPAAMVLMVIPVAHRKMIRLTQPLLIGGPQPRGGAPPSRRRRVGMAAIFKGDPIR